VGAFTSSVTRSRSESQLVNGIGIEPNGCSASLNDPRTGCQVVLVGCFHGSKSSAQDTECAIGNSTNVVVLELCESRFADLRRDFLLEAQSNSSDKVTGVLPFYNMVRVTSAKRGLSAAVAATILGSVSQLQTALSGMEPGLEFSTALRLCYNRTDIVLADQNVDEILSQLGRIPQMSLLLWRDFLVHNNMNWSRSSFCRESQVLARALFGGDSVQGVQLLSFATRSKAAMAELAKLVVPQLLLIQTVNVLLTRKLMPPDYVPISEVPLAHGLSLAALNALGLGMMYLSVALPITRIILSERDEHLASGILKACERAGPDGRVVAVLGFLHVNGVARLLCMDDEIEKENC